MGERPMNPPISANRKTLDQLNHRGSVPQADLS